MRNVMEDCSVLEVRVSCDLCGGLGKFHIPTMPGRSVESCEERARDIASKHRHPSNCQVVRILG